jgi:cell division protein FtsN
VATVPADTGLPEAQAETVLAPVAEAPAVQTAGNGATITGKEITANRPKDEAVLNASAPRPLPPAPAAPTVSPEVGPATYTVLAGLYRRQSGLEKAEKVIRNLGFQPEVVTLTEEKEMIRLLVGTFPRDEAQTRLAALRTEVPDAFLLGQGDRASIYAGSFSSAEYARQQAARLAGKGIETGTEVVRVPITGYRISFGVFADRDAARKAAERAAAGGLEAPRVKAL